MSYIIKSELNGIQGFIFNIKSKGAAKALKARSFMIEALSLLIEDIYCSVFKNAEKIYTGGGNVYLEVNEDEWNELEFKNTSKKIERQLIAYNISFSITYEIIGNEKEFGRSIQTVNNKLNKEKLRFGRDDSSMFEPLPDKNKDQKVFIDFSKSYSEHTSYEIQEYKGISHEVIADNEIRLSNRKLILNTNNEVTLLPLPLWNSELRKKYSALIDDLRDKSDPEYTDPKDKNIIGFEYLAGFAKARTGTDSIGILKLDVDNLGRLFQLLPERKDNKILSSAIKEFFSNGVINLLNKKFGEETYKENIYTVFAGGDDCFFIGAWDAIIEFTVVLQKEFTLYEKDNIRNKLRGFTNPITLSSSVVIVDSHFPIVRFAEIAEENLKKAKSNKQDGKKDAADEDMKNNINFMGHTFTWDEFYELEKVKNTLYNMIMIEKESKAFLHRIINSFENSNTVYWHNCRPAKPFNPAILWRFLYSFRDMIQKDEQHYFRQKGYYDTFFSRTGGYYKKYVWDQFKPGKELSQIMPVAVRWTELLTRTINE